MSDVIQDAKRALRAETRERRQILSDAQRRAAETGITIQLDALLERFGAGAVSCFLSTPIEPGTHAFVAGAMARGIRVLLPITRADGLLDWVVSTPGQELVEAELGVPEPVAEVLGPMAVDDVDLMVIPAASVDRTGMRLGWGRGYFDKTLGSIQNCPPVYAVVFDSEFVDAVPFDELDQPVDGVVTPTRTIDIPRS